MSTTLTESITTDGELVLTWQVHLAKEQPQRFAGVIIVILGVMLLAALLFGSLLSAIIMAFVLFGALSDFFLPVKYTLTTTHVSASTRLGKRTMAWKDVRRCYLDEYGIKISPLRRRSRLEAYRGVYLRFGDRKEEVLDAVKRLKPKDV